MKTNSMNGRPNTAIPAAERGIEIVSKRSAFEKHFDLGNGHRQAVVFPENVHFQKDGSWEEIDNTLVDTGSGQYLNKANPLALQFDQDRCRVTAAYEGCSVTFEPASSGQCEASVKQGSELAAGRTTFYHPEQQP